MPTSYLGTSILAPSASLVTQAANKTASYTLTASDEVVCFTGTSLTATLPSASATQQGQTFTIINGSTTSALALATSSGNSINGTTSGQWFSLPFYGAYITVIALSGNWMVIDSNIPSQTAGDFQPDGIAAAGATGLLSDAGHVHPGSLYAAATATPASPQSIATTTGTTVTGCSASTQAYTYFIRVILTYTGGAAAGTPEFGFLTSGTVATAPQFMVGYFGNETGSATGQSVGVQTTTVEIATGTVNGPTMTTSTICGVIEGMVSFTTTGTVAFQAKTSSTSDAVKITNALMILTPVNA